MTILCAQHMTILANTVCLSQPIYGFTQTQHHILGSFCVLELYSTHCSHHGSLCLSLNSHLTFFLAPCFTSIQYYWPYITPINSFRGNQIPYSNSPYSLNSTQPHPVQAITAASHPPPELTLSPRHVNSLTVST